MGQQLFKVHLSIDDTTVVNSDANVSNAGTEDITSFFPLPTNPNELIIDQQISKSQKEHIKQIRQFLSIVTKQVHWDGINSEIDEILTNQVFTFISEQNKKLSEEAEKYSTFKQQLQTSLIKKLKYDNYANVSVFEQPFMDISSEDNTNIDQQKAKYQSEQVSYFAIQSLVSILLILIKSVEKTDPTIIHQIIILSGQLCEQLPMKCISSSNGLLVKSLEPIISYIHELALTTNPIISKQATKILLSFSIAKGSFIDILSLLSKLIFNTSDIYNVQGLFRQLNNGLTETINEWEKQKQQLTNEEQTDSDTGKKETTVLKEVTEISSLEYLKSIDLFPGTKLNEELLTGQFISSIILSHIDIENEINSPNKQSKLSSFSSEFHPKTFKYLFNIIEQLTISQLNNVTIHILTICLRLFTTHLQFLSDMKTDDHINLSAYATADELNNWFELLLKLSFNESSEQIVVSKEASKAVYYVINIKTSSFPEKISLIHQYVIENKHPILITQFFIELNKNETLLNWIEILCDENQKFVTLDILYSFIDLYFNSKEEQKSSIQQILFSLQQLFISRLVIQSEKKILTNAELQLPSLIAQYLNYIFKNYMNKISIMNDLFDSILIGLCLMTKINEIFVYEAIQPVFISILPLLAEYYLQNLNNEYNQFICFLLGKMSHVLIIGSSPDSLEIKYLNKLKLPVFAGGCITDKSDYILKSNLAIYSQYQLTNDAQDDKEFLMSIYNNVNEGAQLISKLKMFVKDKQLLQKSIQQQANDACAALFAVYLKYYRRINLAKSQLLQADQTKPYSQLLTIYQYANNVQTVFATVKGQGVDCDEFYKQIKNRTLVLLLSVKESNLIPIIEEELSSLPMDIQPKKEIQFQRQYSRWTKARHIIKLLRNVFKVCIRLKKIMLEEKQKANEQKLGYESSLHRSIENFVFGDYQNASISTTNEEKQLEIDELQKCLCRQHERALIRLISYQFSRTFLQNILNLNNNDQSIKILSIYLPYLKPNDIKWSYFDNIPQKNTEEISNNYHSIIKLILSSSLQSPLLEKTIFYLLNLSYEPIDMYQSYYQTLFTSFVSYVQNNTSLDLKLSAFNWFRLFVFKLCENMEMEKLKETSNKILQKQEKLVFRILILNEFKGLKQMRETLVSVSEEQKKNSLKDIALGWFIRANESNMSNQSQIDLCINQYLILLFRCLYFYKHISSICATVGYLEELLYIYHHSQSNTTRLLTVKVLRYLIPYIPDSIDGTARNLIEKFLIEVLNSIGENIISEEIVAELVYMYRTIMSVNSSWQIMTTEFVFDSIKSHLNLNSIETNDIHQMNKLLASLCILGGYIEPYRLGSIVKVKINETSLALIIDIDSNIDNGEISYTTQHFQINEIECATIDKLQLEIDVPPPNLLSLPIPQDSILDTLGYFIQIDTSTTKSLRLLELKRRCVSILYYILNDKTLVESFMEKPYASVIANLCLFNSLENTRQQPIDLRVFNKQHLEQYCLSLDTCEKLKQIIEDKNKDILHSTKDQADPTYSIWNVNENNRDQLVIEALSTPALKYNGWKPYASDEELKKFKQGRLGNDEISIVSMPRDSCEKEAIQECGIKHKFRGGLVPSDSNTKRPRPTFIVDNLQLSEGKWYYCVRTTTMRSVQIGWATNGFTPSDYSGVGRDLYSWSYDGSRGVLANENETYATFNGITWKENDICGCGIEINGETTKIKYWMNGKLLGTGFSHNPKNLMSGNKCDLLPNGPATTYYPCVTTETITSSSTPCEFIFSPEDMQDCPLPNGYKPLLLPKSVHTENSIVDYPFNAYLVGDNQQDFFLTTQTKPATNVLRDFVNEHHLETTFTLDDHHLILPDKSNGFLLSVDNDEASSLTITFDFQILSTDEKLDISLLKFDSTDIPWTKTDDKTRCAVIFLSKNRQIKVYTNDKCQTFTDGFPNESFKKLNIHILPGIAAKIQNLAIWKYALSEEQIHRLFNYSLFYIAVDYQQFQEYRKQMNVISFSKNQQTFTNRLLLPFNEPFTEELWERKKKQIDQEDSKYFNSNNDGDYSVIELFGNKTYFVLEKSSGKWLEYTFIFDISIPRWPTTNENLTLIIFNPQSKLYITNEGKLCLESGETKNESESTIILNEYFRLFISVQEEFVQIYFNDKSVINIKVDDDRFQIESNRIDLFKETDLTKNTTDDNTLRISVKSITNLNRAIPIDQVQLPILNPLPISIIESSLIAMGYKKSWIESVIQQCKAPDISTIHGILREQKQEFIKTDLENERKRYIAICSRLNPSMNPETLKDLIDSSTVDTSGQMGDVDQRIFSHFIRSQLSEQSIDKTDSEGKFDPEWFSQCARDLGIPHSITGWMQVKVLNTINENDPLELFDWNKSEREQTTNNNQKPIRYSHQNISSKQFLQSRVACEHGLTTIYARYAILNMLKVWSPNRSNLFPLEKFGDYTFLIVLIKSLDCTKIEINEKIDQVYILMKSFFKNEIKQSFEHIDTIDTNILQSKAPLLYHLQKYVVIQSIQFLLKSSLFKENSDEEAIVNEQQPNFSFIVKILRLFMDVITDKSMLTQHQIDSLIPILFPMPLTNLMFYLLLLVPGHQSKTFFLHLFTTLIQTSKDFDLNDQIQQFFIQFLIELSPDKKIMNNSSKNKLPFALRDLIFVLSMRQKKQQTNENSIQMIKSKISKEEQELFSLIDAIIAWNDPIKQTPLPETFLELSKDCLDDEYKVNQDDFQKSVTHFSAFADQELINLMNRNQSASLSFTSFISTLPTESEPNSSVHKAYISLSNIPTDCIQIRARFIYLLSVFVYRNRLLIDISLPSGYSIITDQVRTILHYMLTYLKFIIIKESLEQTETPYGECPSVEFDTVKASTDIENSETTMFYQAYRQLYPNAHNIFRQPQDQLWRAQYLGMHSTDAGGPYRDSITHICSDICSTRLSLFILCPNGRTNSGLNRDCWIPNVFPPNKSIPNKIKKQYRFVGQLMGMAIRRKHYLDLKFPTLLWKQLLKEQITIEDIQAIDAQSFTIINEMEKNIEKIQSTDTDADTDFLFDSILSELRFDVASSSGITYELIPSGSDIPVTAANFKQYCSSYRQYRLNEFNRQIDCIRQGLYNIVPCYYLRLLMPNELEEAVCGSASFDIELLKRNTSYGGTYNQESPVIQRFWTVLGEMFNDDQRKLFLIFSWGRNTLPTRDEDFSRKFTIETFEVYEGDVDKKLPRSHTCYFIIDLPAYTTAEIMYERLNYAMTYCSSIDGDGTMNDAPTERALLGDDD